MHITPNKNISLRFLKNSETRISFSHVLLNVILELYGIV